MHLQGLIRHAVKRLEDGPCNRDVHSLKIDQDTSYTVDFRWYFTPSIELFKLGDSSIIT